MDKKIFLNSKEIGFIKSNGEIYRNKYGMNENIGRLQSNMPIRVINSSGKQVAYVEYKQGKYCAYENESTEIVIESYSSNKASLHFGDEIRVEGGSEEEAIGVAILLSRYETKDVLDNSSTTAISRTAGSSSSSSRASYTSSSSTKSESLSSHSSSKTNNAGRSVFSKACIAVIAVAFIFGLLITQITSCSPMGKLSGEYSPTNEFVYEVDRDIPISGTIYIKLEKNGRYHLYYDMKQPSLQDDSIWGDWTEENGFAKFDNTMIEMKSDKSIHVTIRTGYYKNNELKYQNVTHVLRKK